jgi:hypothetical protein
VARKTRLHSRRRKSGGRRYEAGDVVKLEAVYSFLDADLIGDTTGRLR